MKLFMGVKKSVSCAVAGVVLLLPWTTPAHATLMQADFVGQVTNIIADPFGGLSVGAPINGRTIFDDALVTGISFENVAYQSLSFDFSTVGTVITPANTAADPFNVLEFSFSDLIGMNVFAEVPVGFMKIQYVQSGGAFFDILDGDTLDVMLSGSFVLPPGSIVPAAMVPAPATLPLLAGGLMVLMAGRRRRNA